MVLLVHLARLEVEAPAVHQRRRELVRSAVPHARVATGVQPHVSTVGTVVPRVHDVEHVAERHVEPARRAPRSDRGAAARCAPRTPAATGTASCRTSRDRGRRPREDRGRSRSCRLTAKSCTIVGPPTSMGWRVNQRAVAVDHVVGDERRMQELVAEEVHLARLRAHVRVRRARRAAGHLRSRTGPACRAPASPRWAGCLPRARRCARRDARCGCWPDPTVRSASPVSGSRRGAPSSARVRTQRLRYHSARPSRMRTPWNMPSPANQCIVGPCFGLAPLRTYRPFSPVGQPPFAPRGRTHRSPRSRGRSCRACATADGTMRGSSSAVMRRSFARVHYPSVTSAWSAKFIDSGPVVGGDDDVLEAHAPPARRRRCRARR